MAGLLVLLHVQGAEEEQELQDLHLAVARPDALRQVVELGEDVLHRRVGTGHIPSPLGSELLHQLPGADVDLRQDGREVLRRLVQVHGDGDAPVAAQREAGLRAHVALAGDGQVPGGEAAVGVAPLPLRPAFPAVADLKGRGRGSASHPAPGLPAVRPAELDAGKDLAEAALPGVTAAGPKTSGAARTFQRFHAGASFRVMRRSPCRCGGRGPPAPPPGSGRGGSRRRSAPPASAGSPGGGAGPPPRSSGGRGGRSPPPGG